MAAIKPPSAKTKTVGSEQSDIFPIEAVTQVPPNKKVTPLQLTGVPDSVKIDYKAYSAKQNKAMGVLFVEMFEFYQQHHKA